MLFKKPTLDQVMQEELYEAQRKLLLAETALEYAQSEVAYQSTRIARLTQKMSATKKVTYTSGLSQ